MFPIQEIPAQAGHQCPLLALQEEVAAEIAPWQELGGPKAGC